MAKTKKDKKPAQPFWQALVETFFKFCEKNLGDKPGFDGSAPRDLNLIVEALKKRAADAGVEWTKEEALGRLEKFLTFAFQDDWLSQNFILFNLNRQKDKIFFKIKSPKNGTARFTSTQSKPVPQVNPSGGFGSL